MFVGEFGYKRPASAGERSLWIPAGAFYNASPYPVFRAPRTSSDYAAFALVDTQLIKTSGEFPARGVYGGFSFIDGNPNVDATHRYVDGRIYGVGLVSSRPSDFVSVVYTATDFSARSQALFTAKGLPAFDIINNLSASYSAKLFRGVFLVNGVTYGDHATSSPVGRAVFVLSSTLSLVF